MFFTRFLWWVLGFWLRLIFGCGFLVAFDGSGIIWVPRVFWVSLEEFEGADRGE